MTKILERLLFLNGDLPVGDWIIMRLHANPESTSIEKELLSCSITHQHNNARVNEKVVV